MSKFTPILKRVFLMLVFFASVQISGQNTGYFAFIPDAAGNIDREGFNIGYHAIYSQWDLNGDGVISENEFYTVLFKRLDSNKNGSLSLKEWTPGEKYLFGIFLKTERERRNKRAKVKTGAEITGFEFFDSNKDKKITPGEFDAGIKVTGYFQSYDTNKNGRINREELNNGVFRNMDLDGNGIIEKHEFETVNKLYID